MSFVIVDPKKHESGQNVTLKNIQGGKLIGEIIRTCLGPRAMLKMLLDPNGGIVLTNDGNCVLREINVTNASGKSVVELARAQHEEVGDGTTSVVLLTAAVFSSVENFIKDGVKPTLVCWVLRKVLEDAIKNLGLLSESFDPKNDSEVIDIIASSLATKPHVEGLLCKFALDSVKIAEEKKYVRIEKIPGGLLSDSRIINGVVLNKDVTHPSNMRRMVKNPRIVLLDCSLEYNKGESQTAMELTSEDHLLQVLKDEEEWVAQQCRYVMEVKPDLVLVEKGVSDVAQHCLSRANISVIRRVRKSDLMRAARAVGAIVVSQPELLCEEHVGTRCGLFEVRKIGDEYFAYIEDCKEPKACTVLLRGPSKDIINEYERSFDDAFHAALNALKDPRFVYGAGSVYQSLSIRLVQAARASISAQYVDLYIAIARSFEVIPLTLAQNAGANPFKTVGSLREMHSTGRGMTLGIDGMTGKCADPKEMNIKDSFSVVNQIICSSFENVIHILRVDNILSASKKKSDDTTQCANPDAE